MMSRYIISTSSKTIETDTEVPQSAQSMDDIDMDDLTAVNDEDNAANNSIIQSGINHNITNNELPWVGIEKYFQYKSEKGNNFLTLCVLCGSNSKYISTCKTSLSNLRRHMKRVHSYQMSDFEKILEQGKSSKRKCIDFEEKESKDKVQLTLDCYGSGKAPLTQKHFDNLLLKFFIDETQPLNLVDKPAFINLIRLGLPREISVMCRQTLNKKIGNLYSKMIDDTIQRLSGVLYVATTADCWSHGKRAYLGVTCHWINAKNLQRESASLACSRVKGRHTYDILAKELFNISSKFKIQNKITCTTTDNGSNFVKAFKVFTSTNDHNDDNSSDEENNIQAIDLFELINRNNEEEEEEEEKETVIQLPQHFRCASHTLDLIAKRDVDKMIQGLSKNNQLKKYYRKLISKCSSMWNKQNQSTLVAEYVHSVFGVFLKTPNQTRWNCMYDALLQVKKLTSSHDGINKINRILDFCEILRFTFQETTLLQEYCDVMEPLADTLDFLQGEKGMFMGYLLPTLYALQIKLTELEKKNLIYCGELLNTIKKSVKERFEPIWEKKEFVLACCLMPRFKLNWLEGPEKLKAEGWLKAVFETEKSVQEVQNSTSEDESEFNNQKKDFFCLLVTKKNHAINEVENYLNSESQEISSLFMYPILLKLFLEYNTPLPSSAPVERLFSTGSIVMTVKRFKLSDDLFEQLVILKQNKVYT